VREFVSFLARKGSARITVNLALEWATQDANHRPCEWAARLSVVRGFARHWSATDPLTEVPPPGLLPYRPTRAQPYFYSDHEIQTLLKAANPVLPSTRCVLGPTTVCSGCWRSQACGWVRRSASDLGIWIGPKAFTIRGAKFGKSRLGSTAYLDLQGLADYAKRRDERFGVRAEGYSW